MKIEEYSLFGMSEMQNAYQDHIDEHEEEFVVSNDFKAGWNAGRKDLEQENKLHEEFTGKLKVAVEALEFYGSPTCLGVRQGHYYRDYDPDDKEHTETNHGDKIHNYGKRAREALEKIKGRE
jgi:hypothetical protein